MRPALSPAACAAATVLAALSGGDALAQASGPPKERITDTLAQTAEAPVGLAAGSFILAPIPLSNPTIGNGLTVVGGYLFQLDAKSDTSFAGIAYMRTDNGTEAAGAAANLSFGEGRWSVLAAYAQADVNYTLSGLSDLDFGGLPISQDGAVAKLRVLYGLTDALSVGIDSLWLSTTVSPDRATDGLFPVLPGFGIEVTDLLAGLVLEWDTVDDNIYPTTGARIQLTAQQGRAVALGGDFESDYGRAIFDVRAYAPLTDSGVLALRGTLCRASSGTPFYNLCALGATDGMRGFAFGEALGGALASVQGEYRQRLGPRFAVTAFAGAGAVSPRSDRFEDSETRYAGGIGLRYRLSRKFPLDFSLDGAFNDADQGSTYVYLGQSF